MPRGGVPVASEVARALRAPLDVFLVRKLGASFRRELAMGAIASGGVRVLDTAIVDALGIPTDSIDAIAREETTTSRRRPTRTCAARSRRRREPPYPFAL